MKKFTCPYCFIQLNINGQLILVGAFPNGQKGLVLLSEEIGDYTVHLSPDIQLGKGEKAQFSCPCCQKPLEYSKDKDFVRIVKHDEKNEEYSVVFSAIFGEHCTYKISEERTLTYGESAIKYQNPEWYLQEE